MERAEILCCGKKSLPKVFLIVFGLGAFVGFIDYFLVKSDLDRRHVGDQTYYRLHHGISIKSTFEQYVAYYGKSYSTEQEYNARKTLFEASKLEIERVRKADGPSSTYSMELNEFADMTDKEFKTFWTGGKPLDEPIDDSIFYDFENEEEIDNINIKKYLDDMETNPDFIDGHGTLDESIEQIVPDNHYGPIGDDVLDNPYDKIADFSFEEAQQIIDEMAFEKSLQEDKNYEDMDEYVKLDPIVKRRQLEGWMPFQPIKPLQLDWRSKGAVSRVKRQGRCGACWAIAAAGALEGANAIHTGELTEMSEQQILDCASMYPFRSVKCDGGYISEALRYSKTTLIATRENYPYLGFNNTCRKISQDDLRPFQNIPKLSESLIQFWTEYYQEKFWTQLKEVPQSKESETKVKASDKQYDEYWQSINFISMEMDAYQIPISAKDNLLDKNHQWKIVLNELGKIVSLFDSDGFAFVDPMTSESWPVEKSLSMVSIKAQHFYRLWQSSPRKLKKALKQGPVTVMVNSQTPFKFYREGVIDTNECKPDVDHAVLAVGYGTYTNSEGKIDDYFILKNSWGKYWGEQGYARITANKRKFGKGMCGIYVESYIPFVEKDQDQITKYQEQLEQ